jgi:hypothetical protein
MAAKSFAAGSAAPNETLRSRHRIWDARPECISRRQGATCGNQTDFRQASVVMGGEVLVPLVAIFCIFGLPVLALVYFRILRHRERMEMIRNGVMPSGASAKAWRSSGSASASFAARRPAPTDEESEDSARCMLRKGIMLSFIGFALTVGLSFIGLHDDGWVPGPWLLGGLIPMFIGIAQVCIAMLSGATLGAPNRPEQTYYGSMPPPSGPPGPPPNFDTSYTYRPGSTQELRPPSAPPERRS